MVWTIQLLYLLFTSHGTIAFTIQIANYCLLFKTWLEQLTIWPTVLGHLVTKIFTIRIANYCLLFKTWLEQWTIWPTVLDHLITEIVGYSDPHCIEKSLWKVPSQAICVRPINFKVIKVDKDIKNLAAKTVQLNFSGIKHLP